jgi:HK97 family phage major capsid protein
MLDDAFFNVEDWINSELAVEFSEQEEIAFTSGNGTKNRKASWPTPPLWMTIKPVPLARCSTFFPVRRLV